jgi:hypothetical protein
MNNMKMFHILIGATLVSACAERKLIDDAKELAASNTREPAAVQFRNGGLQNEVQHPISDRVLQWERNTRSCRLKIAT